MKTNIFLMATGASCLMLVSQADADENDLNKDQVPKPVVEAFEKAHPNARDVEFEEKRFESNPAYEIDFKENGKEYKFLYRSDGLLIQQKEEDDND